MKQLLYLEVPTPDLHRVRSWLHHEFMVNEFSGLEKQQTPQGIRIKALQPQAAGGELSIFLWSLQRTTYLKVFRWGLALPQEQTLVDRLQTQLKQAFPPVYPEPPQVDLSQTSIFEALAEAYPQTVKYFQKIPNGEADLTRVYWWEQRWRQGVREGAQGLRSPRQVIFQKAEKLDPGEQPPYDLIYIGGALGIIHATRMAQLGHRVLLVERLPFGRMNREWNISRAEFQTLIDLNLFTTAEFESIIAAEYEDGFHKFFDHNNPPQAKAPVLHTPTVLNIAINAERFLKLCGEKFLAAGGEIWDRTEFQTATIAPDGVMVNVQHLPSQTPRVAQGRLLIDAMGTASPIAWQLNEGRPFDSVCPTVGAVFSGLDPAVWDLRYGDVLNSHGDISRGRQLIWELFPAEGEDVTVYLFHYHQVHPNNPGSLLEMYEDFFSILPEYRRCDLDQLQWKKATFGYIPGYFSKGSDDRPIAFDRVLAIGDAASLQSPLIFTGFGSLVRNLPRLSDLLHLALQQDHLDQASLNFIRAYQSNVAVTWLFSKGMMVPTGQILPPERINATLNTFFKIITTEPPAVGDAFMKDRADWWMFSRMAIKAATMNPILLLWIVQLAGLGDIGRWLWGYVNFSLSTIVSFLLAGWFPQWVNGLRSVLEPRWPRLWFWLRAQSYVVTTGIGKSWTSMRSDV
jgi:lycopene cyclase CruA